MNHAESIRGVYAANTSVIHYKMQDKMPFNGMCYHIHRYKVLPQCRHIR